MRNQRGKSGGKAASSSLARQKVAIGAAVVASGLVLTIVLLLLRGGKSGPEQVPATQLAVADGYFMFCKKCRNEFEVKRTEFETWPTVDGAFKCPKCGAGGTLPVNAKVTPMVEVPP